MSRPAISAIITFHREGILCVPSLRSYLQCCEYARSQGILVQTIATLDRSDRLTRDFFQGFATNFDVVEHLDLGDPALCRNAATQKSEGSYVAYFDGDDLWGEEWLSRAIRFAEMADPESVFHPNVLYCFSRSDFAAHSPSEIPSPLAISHVFVHEDSTDPEFDRDVLWFDNVWSANSFGPRNVYLRHPFPEYRRESGFGIEDWSWNHRTLRSGVAHRVVPGTVHIVRMKEVGSFGKKNTADGLLPTLYD